MQWLKHSTFFFVLTLWIKRKKEESYKETVLNSLQKKIDNQLKILFYKHRDSYYLNLSLEYYV